MSSREVQQLKTSLKATSAKTMKRTPTPRKVFSPVAEPRRRISAKSPKSPGRPRSRSRSRTPTRKIEKSSRTATPRVSSANKRPVGRPKSPSRTTSLPSSSTSTSRQADTPSSQKPSLKTSSSASLTESASKRKRTEDVNDNKSGSANKKVKSALQVTQASTPASGLTRRSTRLITSTVKAGTSSSLGRSASQRAVTFDSSANPDNNNQRRGWLSYCSVM